MQGVCINIFVKRNTGKKKAKPLAKVYHADLYGLRKNKYRALETMSVDSVEWTLLEPVAPNYFLVPKDDTLRKDYDQGFSIEELMPLYSCGFYSARDKFAIRDSKEELAAVVDDFLALEIEEARVKFELGKDSGEWTVVDAREDLLSNTPTEDHYTQVSYRPFDDKWTYYSGKAKGFLCRPRPAVMDHMAGGENIALVTTRLVQQKCPFAHVFATTGITDKTILSGKDNATVFPLWVKGDGLLDEWTPNFNHDAVAEFEKRTGMSLEVERGKRESGSVFTPFDLYCYIYGVLSDPSYREKFDVYLRESYPKVAYPTSVEQFWNYSNLGERLVACHTLDREMRLEIETGYPVTGSNEVDDIKYVDGNVWINSEQHFSGVEPDVWNYSIGGNQPAQKWLKDRKGKTLAFADTYKYQQILAAIKRCLLVEDELRKLA